MVQQQKKNQFKEFAGECDETFEHWAMTQMIPIAMLIHLTFFHGMQIYSCIYANYHTFRDCISV